jgi:hypothetical protein
MQDPKRPQALNSGTNVQECRINVSIDAFDRLRVVFSVHLVRQRRATRMPGAPDWGEGVTYLYPGGSGLAREGGLGQQACLLDVPKSNVCGLLAMRTSASTQILMLPLFNPPLIPLPLIPSC